MWSPTPAAQRTRLRRQLDCGSSLATALLSRWRRPSATISSGRSRRHAVLDRITSRSITLLPARAHSPALAREAFPAPRRDRFTFMPFSREASRRTTATAAAHLRTIAQRRRAQRTTLRRNTGPPGTHSPRPPLADPVSGGDGAHLHLQRLFAADARTPTTASTWPTPGRSLSPLVEKMNLPPSAGSNRPACARSRRERAASCPNSSDSISSGGMAAQLTFTTAYRPAAGAVKRTRDQLLAVPTRRDQHAGLRQRHLRDLGEQRVHRRSCPPSRSALRPSRAGPGPRAPSHPQRVA